MNKIPVLAGVCVFHKGKLLLLKLIKKGDDNGKWGPPGGYGEEGETVIETAIRETKEETNLDVEISGLVQETKIKDTDGRRYMLILYFAEIEDISKFKIDPIESSAYAWVSFNDIESEKYLLRSESVLQPILIKAFKDKPLPLNRFGVI